MKTRIALLTIFSFLFSLVYSQSQEDSVRYSTRPYIVESDYPAQLLAENTQILLDSSHQLTLEEVLNRQEDFSPLTEKLYLVDTQQTVWLRVTIHTKIDINNWWIIFKKMKLFRVSCWKRKSRILGPVEAFFEFHSSAMER